MDVQRTVTVREAARVLHLSPAAVRKRILRGTLHATKVDSEWMVTLPRDADEGRDRDATVAQPALDTGRDRDVLVDALKGQIDHLQGQLAEASREKAEMRLLLGQALQRVPQLPAPETEKARPWWRFWH